MKGMRSSSELLFDRTKDYSILTQEEEQELFRQYIKYDNQEAKKILYYSNIKLVRKVATQFLGRNFNLDDLMIEGLIGVGKAIDKFNIGFGYRFSTYAIPWIKQQMLFYVKQCDQSIKIPVNTQKIMFKIKRFIDDYEAENGKEPTDEIIKKELKMKIDDVRKFKQYLYIQSVISLNECVSDTESTELLDLCMGEYDPLKDDINYNLSVEMAIENCLSILSDREQKIIILRYGLYNNEVHTLEQLSKIFGVNRERIRQIEMASLEKIRKYFKLNQNQTIEDGKIIFQNLCKKKKL